MNIARGITHSQKYERLLATLICEDCKNYLNVPPVMIYENGDMICGRCYIPGLIKEGRTKASLIKPYEALVELFVFPCMYQKSGCTEKPSGKHVAIHEAICQFRPYNCPVQDCSWSGVTNQLKIHYKDDHPNIYIPNSLITFDSTKNYELNYFILDNEIEFIFQCKFDVDSKKIWCNSVCVTTPEYNHIYYMELEFLNKDTNTSITFKKETNQIIQTIDINKALEIDLNSINTLLNNPDTLQANLKLKITWNDNNIIESNLLNDLKCPICDHLFVSPIYLCSNGHSICQFCKENVTICPVCRVDLGTVHNYLLEQVVSQLYYPCKYNNVGCRIIAPATEILSHEQNCSLATLE